MPDGYYSVSDIQYYIEYIIKKHETLTTIPLVYVYINRIINRLVFQIKDGYRLQLPEAMKLTCPSLEVVELVLVQCNLVDNQYQQKSETSYTFTTN